MKWRPEEARRVGCFRGRSVLSHLSTQHPSAAGSAAPNWQPSPRENQRSALLISFLDVFGGLLTVASVSRLFDLPLPALRHISVIAR